MNKFGDRADTKEHLRRVQDAMACTTIRTNRLHQIEQDIFFGTCIGNFVRDWVPHFIELHDQYERGVMPFPGTILNQPVKVVEIFQVIGGHKAAKLIEANQKAKRDLKQSGRKNRPRIKG